LIFVFLLVAALEHRISNSVSVMEFRRQRQEYFQSMSWQRCWVCFLSRSWHQSSISLSLQKWHDWEKSNSKCWRCGVPADYNVCSTDTSQCIQIGCFSQMTLYISRC
jgi:hypothetical protein